MNWDWQEKRIRRLFHDLSHEDERNIPAFASVAQSALLREMAHRGPRRWRLAAAIALPLMAVVCALLLVVSNSTRIAPPGDFTTLQTIPLRGPYDAPGPEIMHPPDLPVPPIHIKAPVSRRAALATRNSSIAISQWRSPTDSLLRVPGEELLKSLPRIPDSSPGIPRSLNVNRN